MSIQSKLSDLEPFKQIADAYELEGEWRQAFMKMVIQLLNLIEQEQPLTEERSNAEETLIDTVEEYCEMYYTIRRHISET